MSASERRKAKAEKDRRDYDARKARKQRLVEERAMWAAEQARRAEEALRLAEERRRLSAEESERERQAALERWRAAEEERRRNPPPEPPRYTSPRRPALGGMALLFALVAAAGEDR